jgi:hypothetical protein
VYGLILAASLGSAPTGGKYVITLHIRPVSDAFWFHTAYFKLYGLASDVLFATRLLSLLHHLPAGMTVSARRLPEFTVAYSARFVLDLCLLLVMHCFPLPPAVPEVCW